MKQANSRSAIIAPVLIAAFVVGCQPQAGTDPLAGASQQTDAQTATTTTTPLASNPTTTTTTSTTTTSTTTTTTTVPFAEGDLLLWDTAWQIVAKADEAAMAEYVDRLAAVRGSAGQSVTGFWFSVVNINQDLNTPNGNGHQFGSFDDPADEYLRDAERLIALAHDAGLRVGIVVAWDGPNQFSVEQGKLNRTNAYAYGNTLAARWTRPDLEARKAIAAWIMGGDTTDDCCGGEHGEVWSEVVRGIRDGEAANGFDGGPVLFHTAPRQQLHYLGAQWLDGHAPQTGHCADSTTAAQWLTELFDADGRTAPIWGNGEMRYENIQWECNGFEPISPEQVLADAKTMAELSFVANHVYGYDPRWNSGRPGETGMSGDGVSAGLQMILDEPGLVQTRPPLE